jgi:stage II sporulation protein R
MQTFDTREEEPMATFKKALMIMIMAAAVCLLGACGAAPFRLHVIANSDSVQDQQIKLAVRDAVLYVTQDGVLECDNEKEAEEYIKEHIDIILKTANTALEESGADYRAAAYVGTYHFPDKTYNDVTYPEGDYRALRIVLGDGEGQNWWCVMFPPLCLSEIGCDTSDDDTEYASYFAELFEKMFGVRP